MKTVLITGASAGIGKATCEYLVRCGYYVFGSVRKVEDGERLKLALGPNFMPLLFDVTDPKQIEASKKLVSKHLEGQTMCALINNAGIATMGPVRYLDIDDFRRQLDIKVIGTLACTQAFLPFLGVSKKAKEPKGRVINISSILGGKIGVPFLSGYCASKHALEGFSEALRRELMLYGIKVVIVAPGTVETPLWDVLSKESKQRSYEDTEYKHSFEKSLEALNTVNKKVLPMARLTQTIKLAIEAKNPKIRYTITADPMQKFWHLVPRRLVDKLFQYSYGLKKRDIQ